MKLAPDVLIALGYAQPHAWPQDTHFSRSFSNCSDLASCWTPNYLEEYQSQHMWRRLALR